MQHRVGKAVVIGLAIAACYLAVVLLVTGDQRRSVTNSGLLAGAILAATLIWRSAGRMPAERRGPWRLIAAGVFCWGAGEGVFLLGYLPSGGPAIGGVFDVGYLLFYPLVGAGLLRDAGPLPGGFNRVRIMLDGVIGYVSLLVASWVLVIDEVSRRSGLGTTGALVLVSYPFAGVVLLGVALIVVSGVGPGRRVSVLLVISGVAAVLTSDSLYAITVVHGSTVHNFALTVGWLLGFLLIWAAAVSRVADSDAVEHGASGPAWSLTVLLLPYVLVTGMTLVILLSALTGRRVGVMEIVGFVVLLAALLARQVVSILAGRRLTAALQRSEMYFRSLVQEASDVITVIDSALTVRWQSPSAARMLGFAEGSAIGTNISGLVHPEDLPGVRRAFARSRGVPAALPQLLRCRVRDARGAWREVESTFTDHRDNPAIGALVVHTRDATRRRVLERQLQKMAYTDFLTELPNRARLAERLTAALADVQAGSRQFSVLALDLDGFKTVNDLAGHEVGDLLLVEVARRLAGCSRDRDLVVRLGGDEFSIVVEGPLQVGLAVAERALETVSGTYRLGAGSYDVGVSIGITAAHPGHDQSSLLREADLALRSAKTTGKGKIQPYAEQLHDVVVRRALLERDLRQAVHDGQLTVVYQPIMRLDRERTIGVEALLRWQHPERGDVTPAEFIPIAEETGMIVEIQRWVLGEACRQLQTWRERGHDLRLAVNISPRHLQLGGLREDVLAALRDSRLDPGRLILEITESMLLPEMLSSFADLTELHDLGVRIALDDFGKGYSSLAYLTRMPVDILKMDPEFISEIERDHEQLMLTETVVDIGVRLRIDVVAVGVETKGQLAALQAMGCPYGQGFLFAPGLPAAQIEAHLASVGGPVRPAPTDRRLTATG